MDLVELATQIGTDVAKRYTGELNRDLVYLMERYISGEELNRRYTWEHWPTCDDTYSGDMYQEISDIVHKAFITPINFVLLSKYFGGNESRSLVLALKHADRVPRNRNDFESSVIGEIFAGASFQYLNMLVNPMQDRFRVSSPTEIDDIFMKLYPRRGVINNFGIQYGIEGTHIPDGLIFSKEDDHWDIQAIVEYSSAASVRGPETYNNKYYGVLAEMNARRNILERLQLDSLDNMPIRFTGKAPYILFIPMNEQISLGRDMFVRNTPLPRAALGHIGLSICEIE